MGEGRKESGFEYSTQGEGVTIDGYMGHLLSPRFFFFFFFFFFFKFVLKVFFVLFLLVHFV